MENVYVKEELVNLRRCLWENAVQFLASSASGVLQACYIDILLIWRNKSDWSPLGQDLELWVHSVLSGPRKQTPGAALLVEKCSLLYQYIAGCESWLAAWLVQEIISLENCQTSYELRFYTQLVDMLVQCLKVSGMLVPSARLRVLHSTLADDTSARYLLISLLVRDCVPTNECELLKWSEPDVGEDIHTNVCDCIDVIVSSFELQQFSQHNILQLMDILLSLLHNEQPEVRIRCSVSVTNLSRLARSLLHNTCVGSTSIYHLYDIHPPSDTPVHFNIAVQQVLGLLPLLLNVDTTLWVRWLLNHMHSNMTHFTDLIHQPDKVSKMFFQEELNVFYERTILVKAVVALLCSALSTGLVFDAPKVERIESVLPEGMQQSYRELLSCYQQLSDYCASSKCQ
ncbi:hypothetical protein EB796_012845 [Bugula neritina]|uniref:Uncharacterized protein n=1 Tax=Bugula neritina TaxID=10212 RepID=A0A7J7JRA0_BUGNE|nr:hypothetical protein EB796_012845 [Bugula neritina]